jgi:hypothetical protein
VAYVEAETSSLRYVIVSELRLHVEFDGRALDCRTPERGSPSLASSWKFTPTSSRL